MTRAHLWLLINVVLFQVGWLVCVLAGSAWALLYTALALVVHFRWSPVHPWDCMALPVALALGLLHDNLLALAGVLVFPGGGVSPLWLWCLWLLLALTLNHSLRWLYQRPLWAALAGAIAGPMAYTAGVLLSDVSWGILPWQAALVLAFVWLPLLPLHRLLTRGGYRLCGKSLRDSRA